MDKLRNGKNANGEVQYEKGISQIGHDPARKPGAFIVIVGEQPKTLGQASALFGGLNQRQIKGGQRTAQAQHGFRDRGTFGDFRDELRERLAEGVTGRVVTNHFQRLNHADPGAQQRGQLMIQFRAPGQLSGRDDE